jgi:hypothetical protein
MSLETSIIAPMSFKTLSFLWLLQVTVAAAEVREVVTHLPPDFLPEAVEWDGAHSRFLLSSIRKHAIAAIDPANGNANDFGKAPGSVLGLHIDPGTETVWAVWTGFGHGFKENDGTGLSAWSAKDGKHLGDWPLPGKDARANFGDLMVLDANTIVASDSGTGAIWQFDTRSHEYKPIVPAGKFKSPQGLVAGIKAGTIYVADYPTGLWRVSLADGEARQLVALAQAELRGIDGLYRRGNQLIAVQNGTKTPRILVITLGENDAITDVRHWVELTHSDDEPSLGTMSSDAFWFVANGQWSKYDDDLNPKPDATLQPPRLRGLPLSSLPIPVQKSANR